MRYALFFTETAEQFALRDDPEKSGAYWAAWTSYLAAIGESGIVEAGAGLLPPQTATTVRIRDGKRQIHDGPYAESKEMLGGFFIIEVPNLDVALEWAARSPASAYGATEVRPLLPPMTQDPS